MKQIGFSIMLLGLMLTIFTAFTSFTNEKINDIGIIETVKQKPIDIYWILFGGILLIVIGRFMIVKAKRK